ncbi:vesicle transporter SEC22 [Moesziomyces antarcticus]|jgi:vesicle transport protein SEC22|uniref:Protein transport protein SEC22 n=3 Tax=Pseudozyma antarctica TaxID=84753 RepID=A0A081CBZ3_PSEA2|nr:vesicle transporter SEC22 [Moesziomyces antarcticus]GAC72309.1 synaptobrevin/vamp-like protein SEC22 [Moesziomyces antarcticus T-34]GAK64189.1 vesicle transporter SEC22 [Moesziomyces antarcticus]SPO44587.1 probable SEC22 - synaptobrevin (V-SNARE) [Moesziomyces antarcticus]
MPLSTQIARVSDGLPLAQSVDDGKTENDLSEHKQQAKLIFRRITPSSEPRCSIESGKFTLHYLISPPPAMPNSVVYLTIADKSYPRKLAFSYLDELSKEFERSYGNQVEQRTLRPYAFVSFDTFMQRTKRLYEDSRTAQSAASSNLDRLNEDLQDVTRIMTKNMEDLLWRGDSLDQMSTMSSSLRDESLKYRKAARQINLDALYRKWAPVGAVGLLFLFIIWIKFF